MGAEPNPRKNRPAMNKPILIENACRRDANNTMKFPAKLMPRRPMISANAMNGAPTNSSNGHQCVQCTIGYTACTESEICMPELRGIDTRDDSPLHDR